MIQLLFSGTTISSLFANIGLAAARVFAGLTLAFGHGLYKIPPSDQFIGGVELMGFPMPFVFAWSAALSEFLGGLFLAAGIFTRPSAAVILGTMTVAGFIRHANDPFARKELAFAYLALALVFLCLGSTRFGIDHAIRKKIRG